MADLTLPQLASLAGVTPRTVRYYIAQGLLAPPTSTGRAATYDDEHLARLRLIRKLQAEHFPLADIRVHLSPAGAADSQTHVTPPQLDHPRTDASAVDYIRQVLARSAGTAQLPSAPDRAALPSPPIQPSRALDPSAFDAPDETVPEPIGELSRSQWDRLSLAPDIELHVRRPLSRPLNKKVERLVAIARQLLEEDQP